MDHAPYLRQATGLTLMEVLVTTGVMAILALAARPIFSEIAFTYDLHGTTQQVYGELQKARMTAAASNRRCKLSISPSSQVMLDCYDQTDSTWTAVSETTLPSATQPGLYVWASGDIAFAPNGTAAQPGLAVVFGDGHLRIVNVTPAGTIRILRYELNLG